jgi:hypothetical protein
VCLAQCAIRSAGQLSTAAAMTSATARGLLISGVWSTSWEEIRARIRLAMKSCVAGLIIRSCSATRYQEGRSGDGSLDCGEHANLIGRGLLGKCRAKRLGVQPDPALIGRGQLGSLRVCGVAVEHIGDRLAFVGRQCGDEHQTLNPRMTGGGDHRARICVGRQYDWALNALGRSHDGEASSCSDVSGMGAAVTGMPACCSSVMTALQLDPSAHAPWIKTTVGG